MTFKLPLMITALIVMAILAITLLSIRRERQTFRQELEQQASSTLEALGVTTSTSIYFLDVDSLNRIGELLLQSDLIVQVRFYDDQGRLITDPALPDSARQFEIDPYGQTIIRAEATTFDWQTDQLLAGVPINSGGQPVGAISIAFSTSQFEEKISFLRIQGLLVAAVATIVGLMLAIWFSRSITRPMATLAENAQIISRGDLTHPIVIDRGDEIGTLAKGLDEMRLDLKVLYEDMEGQVAARTEALVAANKQLQIEVANRIQAETEMKRARDEAVEASKFKTRLLAMISHELRTPLGSILGYSEMLMVGVYGDLSEEQVNITEKVVASTQYLSSLISDLLAQAKLEAGQLKLKYALFSPHDLLEECMAKIGVIAERKGLSLTSQVDPEMPPLLFGDEDRLLQILINLVGNGIKYTESGGVEVALNVPDDSHWVIKVSDTGPGIPVEQQDKIFEPFQQVDSTITRKKIGTGLGLSIVKEFVILMNGTVSLESQPGQGTVFTVTLPIIGDPEHEENEYEIVV